MTVQLFYEPELARYRFLGRHPMRPERFTLAVSLMEAWGLLALEEDPGERRRAVVVRPRPATDSDLELAHTSDYIAFVKSASADPSHAVGHGIGSGDTPPFPGMHEAAALAVGASIQAVEAVASGRALRSFNPAGGLHHAHRDYASGFCIYNDIVAGIERAIRSTDARIAYVDIDAHHGDGVEAAFAERADVLTVSVHESGRYLFPGTGRATDIGSGAGLGTTIDLPLPPYAGPRSFELVFNEVIAPAVATFAPDILLVQGGADTHVRDPLTHLAQTVKGYAETIERLRDLADEVTGGKLVLLGGGGYRPFDEVPRMWASALAVLLDREVPESLPDSWLEMARSVAAHDGESGPVDSRTMYEEAEGPDAAQAEAAYAITEAVVEEVRAASPLLAAT